jgi:hypothetical protein
VPAHNNNNPLLLLSERESFEKLPGKVAVATCPICTEDLDQVFSCQNCNNSICGQCVDKLPGMPKTCPSCRQDLDSKPLLRNVAAERLFDNM